MEKNNIGIREATNGDSDGIKKLVFTILHEYGLQSDSLTTDSDLDNIEDAYFEKGGVFYVLEDGTGDIVGSIGLYAVDAVTCELRKMYVKKNFRGRGIGKELLEGIVTKANELGFKVIVLETDSVLKEAITLYTSFGFREYKPENFSSRCDKAYIFEL